ncbi:hypothetical protein [Promicromonospora sp. MEB111]|uniref:hypothetical protein n=1 Tax=Promicromonospora sp. MEB111 TaxID=3040301 RepID=UPI00254AA8C0|nr:hypothetical protein [Promicromonospora sp. MEB111]
MWFDVEGVAHTVPLPDPGWAFEPGLLAALTSAEPEERARLRKVLDALLVDAYENLDPDRVPTAHLVEDAIPEGKVGEDRTGEPLPVVERTSGALLAVPYEFRLDGLVALEDLLDELDEGGPDVYSEPA